MIFISKEAETNIADLLYRAALISSQGMRPDSIFQKIFHNNFSGNISGFGCIIPGDSFER